MIFLNFCLVIYIFAPSPPRKFHEWTTMSTRRYINSIFLRRKKMYLLLWLQNRNYYNIIGRSIIINGGGCRGESYK